MKALQIGIVGAAAFLIYSLTRKSVAGSNLFFFPDKVSQFKFEGLTPVLFLGLRVQNTSNVAFTIKSFAANVYSNNIFIGNASSFTQQVVNANSESIVQIKIRLQLIGIVNEIINAFQYKNKVFFLNMKGQTNIDNIQVPVDLEYKVGV